MILTSALSSGNANGLGEALPTDLRLWYNSGSGYTEVSITSLGFCDAKLTIDYDHPAQLTFTLRQPQHTTPIPPRAAIYLADPTYGTSTPIFEGHVDVVNPMGSNDLAYICYDPTKRAGEEVTIFDAPTFASTRTPRAIWNCKLDQDSDYAESRAFDATIGDIIETLLTDPYTTLTAMLAAPDPGGPGGPAYESTDLAALDYVPQDKVVFETETLRAGLDRMTDLYPQFRWVFWMGPSYRKWRLVNVLSSTEKTLTLNDPTAADKVMTLNLERSLEGRKTAVKIVGPHGAINATPQQSTSGLTPQWTSLEQALLETSGPAAVGDHVGAKWQITDSTKRHMWNVLADYEYVPTAGMQATGSGGQGVTSLSFAYTKLPHLIATWDSGTTWEPVADWKITDMAQGIIQAAAPVARKNSGGTWDLPDDVKLYYSYRTEPLSVRYPTSGFSGSAYDDFGMEVEEVIVDPMLAIGYEWGVPVTDTARKAEYVKLAQARQEAKRDTVYRGTATLDGLMYEYLHLDRSINLAAVDHAGDPIVTGWEDAKMILSHVEYDLSAPGGITTLGFNSNLADYSQMDFETSKAKAKIRPYETAIITTQTISGNFNPRTRTNELTIRTDTKFFHRPTDENPPRTLF